MNYKELTDKCQDLYAEKEVLVQMRNYLSGRKSVMIDLIKNRIEDIDRLISDLLDVQFQTKEIFKRKLSKAPKIIRSYMNNPDMTLHEIGRKHGISMQKVSHDVTAYFKR